MARRLPTRVIDLGTFGTVQSAQAFDVNDARQVVGVAGGNRPFIWQNGEKSDLGTLGSGSSASASGINEAGQIVGASALTTPPSGSHAVMWSNGAITDLTPDLPPNQGATATAINEAGQVVGNINYATAFVWQNNARTLLGHLGGGGSAASDINDSGVVVGSSSTNQMTPLGFMAHPFAWQNGVMKDLGLLAGDEDGGASAINNAGQIVGSSGRTDPDTYETFYRAFIYANGVMTALPVPSWEAYAGDINDDGVVVGTMRAGGGVSKFHAWVYVDGVVTNLNTLIPAGTGLHIAYANAINNQGQIAATAFDAQGRYHAVLLTPGEGPPPTPRVSIGDVDRVRRQQRHAERRVPPDDLADDHQPRDSGLQHGRHRYRHRGQRLQRRVRYGDDSCRPDDVGGVRHGERRSQARGRRGVLRESLEPQWRDDRRWPGGRHHSQRRQVEPEAIGAEASLGPGGELRCASDLAGRAPSPTASGFRRGRAHRGDRPRNLSRPRLRRRPRASLTRCLYWTFAVAIRML